MSWYESMMDLYEGGGHLTTWASRENGIEGVYDLVHMHCMYILTVNKVIYEDFFSWLWDVERSGVFDRHYKYENWYSERSDGYRYF